MLKLEKLTYQHRGAASTFCFDLDAKPGEIVAIMGASGSGKSTLLDLIAGFQTASSGMITWDGTDLLPLPPEQRPVTVLFQNHNLFEHVSVERNVVIGINAGRKITSEQSAKVLAALKDVGLAGIEKRLASSLSGGQQQRVALARCMVRQKPILLLDEPFNGLDDETRGLMQTIIKTLAERDNRCVLLVTHEPGDATALGARIVTIKDQKISAA